MKICILTDAWFPVWGGGQAHVWETSKQLVKNHSCEIDIIVPNLTDEDGKKYPVVEKYLSGKLRLLRLGPPFVFPNFLGRLRFILHSTFYILHSDNDLYHSHSPSTSLFLPIAKLRGEKTAITVHGAGANLVGAGLLNKTGIPRLLMRLVLTVWPYDYRFSASTLKGFKTVGNGVNIKEYDAVKAKKDQKFFRIIWAGRKFDPVKGVKYLEEAVTQLKNRYPNILLDIVENVYGQEKIKRFKRADLFVLPSLSEGLPLVLLEAMASGLPVVTTDVGDCRRLVEKSKAGLVVKPGNIDDLKEKILQVYENKRRKQMGEAGKKFVEENYTWEKVAKKIFDTYS